MQGKQGPPALAAHPVALAIQPVRVGGQDREVTGTNNSAVQIRRRWELTPAARESGDRVEIQVEEDIGVLTNEVVAEPAR
jgi:hypothetical protein